MDDWKYLQKDAAEQLAKLHYFSVKKRHGEALVDVRITVWEYASPDIGAMQYFAQTDLALNQKAAPFQPCGWGHTLTMALSECLRNLRKFEYEPAS